MVVLPQSVWEEVTADLKYLRMYIRKMEAAEKSDWVESVEARKMLGISPKTWQTYRDKRIIPFIQFGRKIMVRKSDIEAFMQKHYITPLKDNVV